MNYKRLTYYITILIIIILISGCLPSDIVGPTDTQPSGEAPPTPVQEEAPLIVLPKTTTQSKEEPVVKETPSKPRWPTSTIKFYIVNPDACKTYESNKIRRAFNDITEATDGVVKFKEVKSQIDSQIDLRCTFIEDCYKKITDIREEEGLVYRSESICAHTAGLARNSVFDKDGNFLKADIELIGLAGFSETTNRGMSGYFVGSCGHTSTEVHEILHTFGYEHNLNPKSMMYTKSDSVGYTIQKEGECIDLRKEIDQDIVDDLKNVYSE